MVDAARRRAPGWWAELLRPDRVLCWLGQILIVCFQQHLGRSADSANRPFAFGRLATGASWVSVTRQAGGVPGPGLLSLGPWPGGPGASHRAAPCEAYCFVIHLGPSACGRMGFLHSAGSDWLTGRAVVFRTMAGRAGCFAPGCAARGLFFCYTSGTLRL